MVTADDIARLVLAALAVEGHAPTTEDVGRWGVTVALPRSRVTSTQPTLAGAVLSACEIAGLAAHPAVARLARVVADARCAETIPAPG